MFPVARIESVARRSVRARNGLRAESCPCRGHVVVQPYRASQQTVCQSRRVEFPFAHRQRVRFGETDTQGVVYYANYLLYAEVGRVAYLRELGLDYAGLLERGIDFTVGEASVR